MPKSYQPGQRKEAFGQNYKISDERYAWIITEAGKFLILVGEDKGHGSDVVLFNPRPGRIADVSIKLTDMTIHELTALSELIATAIEWAQPVVKRRDKEAEDAWNEGDDSHSRNYRPVPTVVYRKSPKSEHSESVHERPEGLSEGGGPLGAASDSESGVRGSGDELVEPQSPELESQYDCTQTD